MQNTGLTHFLSHLEGVAATSEERHGLSDVKTDWQEGRDLWLDHVRVEAENVGRDTVAARSASTAYLSACIAFQAKHGIDFDPYHKPE